MAEDSSEDRSEEPTAKKKQQSMEKGQVARSKEFSATLVMFIAGVTAYFSGPLFLDALIGMAKKSFAFDPGVFTNTLSMAQNLKGFILQLAPLLITFMLALTASALAAAIIIGGWNFSMKALAPKFSNMDPIKGIKKLFSVNGLMELAKALGKFVIIGGAGALWIRMHWHEYLDMSLMGANDAIMQGLEHLLIGFLILVAATAIISIVDVPFQIIQNANKLKMTKQEVKQEYKDSEGKPEIKQKVRQLQREMSNRRMMGEVPDADVVITNPTHFAVALRYKMEKDSAPLLLAKGGDELAFKIREIAEFHKVTIVESPLLCRAIYYTTKLDKEIPHGLYKAVAQVLAYVFQLNEFRKGEADRPHLPKNFDIPSEYKKYSSDE